MSVRCKWPLCENPINYPLKSTSDTYALNIETKS